MRTYASHSDRATTGLYPVTHALPTVARAGGGHRRGWETAPAQVMRENPEASNTDILKLMGERWTALDPEAKEKCAGASPLSVESLCFGGPRSRLRCDTDANCAPR